MNDFDDFARDCTHEHCDRCFLKDGDIDEKDCNEDTCPREEDFAKFKADAKEHAKQSHYENKGDKQREKE